MFCKYENDTRIYKIQTRLFPKGHQLGRMQPRIQCWRLQVIWNIQYKNYKFETVHTHTHTHNITFPRHISAWCSSIRRPAGILQRPRMFQTCYHHHLYLFTGRRQLKFNEQAFRSYLNHSLTFFLTLVTFVHWSHSHLFPLRHWISLHPSNDSVAKTGRLRLQAHENYKHLCIHINYLFTI